MFNSANNLGIIEKHFFFIDSTDVSLNDVKTHLYGYCIDDFRVFDGKKDDFEYIEGKDYSGSYVYVRKLGNEVALFQDFIGSYGLFLFRHGDYWALSNSFILLVDKIKTRYPLSLNDDYINASFLYDMSTHLSFTDTLIKEIEVLPRTCKVIIDTTTKKLELVAVDYHEYTVPIDSPEGIRLIDDWTQKWINIIRDLTNGGVSVQVDLSGGFDTRADFVLFLTSGIDMNKIKVRSQDDPSCFVSQWSKNVIIEDYEIASAIAKLYNFRLNQEPVELKSRPLTIDEIINIYFYTKLGFHEVMYGDDDYWLTPVYRFGGGGGEIIRGYSYDNTPTKMLQSYRGRAHQYKTCNFGDSVSRILQKEFKNINETFNIVGDDNPLTSARFYKEIRTRNHYGRCMVELYISNKFVMSPLMDPKLSRLKIYTDTNADPRLLFALLLARYQRELLNFKIQGGRSYNKATIELAEQINAKYPLPASFDGVIGRDNHVRSQPITTDVVNFKSDRKDGVLQPLMAKAKARLLQMTRTKEFKSAFLEHFPEEVYISAQNYADEQKGGIVQLSKINPVIAATRALTDVKISRYMTAESFDRYFNEMKLPVPASQDEMQSKKISLLLELFQTARIEFVNSANRKAEFGIASLDESVPVYSLTGIGGVQSGYMLRSSAKHLKVRLQSQRDDNLVIVLRGNGLSGKNNEFISLPVDFTYLSINGQSVFPDKVVTAHFNNPCAINFRVQRGVIYEFDIRWNVHGYSDEEFMKLFDTAWKDKLIYNYV